MNKRVEFKIIKTGVNVPVACRVNSQVIQLRNKEFEIG